MTRRPDAEDRPLDRQPDRDTPSAADHPLARPSTLVGPRFKMGVALAMVIGAIVYLGFSAFQSATVRYLSVEDVTRGGATPDGRTVGVISKLVGGSFVRSPDGLTASFKVRDEGTGVAMPVRYSGEVGQIFFNEHSELILQGRLGDDGVFDTDRLVVRCPSKFITEAERAEIEAGGMEVLEYG